MSEEYSRTLEQAVRLLSYKSYSVQELSHRLQNYGHNQETIDQVKEYLSKRGYLNDAALCELLVRKYYDSGKCSVRSLVIKLKQRGIPDSIIRDAINIHDDETEYKHALHHAVRKYKSSNDIMKVNRYLASRGYTHEIVAKVLRELRKEASK